jgi:hypothetical protein
VEVGVIRRAVSAFLGDFETRFDQAPKLDQKELIRQVVENIEVNPDKKMVRCYIRRVPKVPAVESIAGKLENLPGGDRSANGNILHPVYESSITELILG